MMPAEGARLFVFLIVAVLSLVLWQIQGSARLRGTEWAVILRWTVYATIASGCLLELAAIVLTLTALR